MSTDYRKRKAIGDWHRKRARRLRILGTAVAAKLANPFAAAHPDYVYYCDCLRDIRHSAWRHTQIAGKFSN